jgi:hypothetical protein
MVAVAAVSADPVVAQPPVDRYRAARIIDASPWQQARNRRPMTRDQIVHWPNHTEETVAHRATQRGV